MEGPAEPGSGSTLPPPFANRFVSSENLTGSAANECCSIPGSFRLQPVLRDHAIVMARDIRLHGLGCHRCLPSESTFY
jgi:hypothetical protein